VTPAARALLDTSVVIDPPADLDDYARSSSVSTITLAELAFGLHSADPVRNAAREARYQLIVQNLEPIPYSASAARLYGALCEAVRQSGRNPRPRRFDLMIASVAADERLPLITRNADDFQGIHPAVRVIAIP
jgi:predicted nucleic acid-binding protein